MSKEAALLHPSTSSVPQTPRPDPIIDFVLPAELEATAPPEARGLGRDDVRLLVSWRTSDRLAHMPFRAIGSALQAGDVLVINTSGTLKAALPAMRADGACVALHLSTRLPGGVWTVELREPDGVASRALRTGQAGEHLHLPLGGSATLLAPYPADREVVAPRLWLAALHLPLPWLDYLEAYGTPIRYHYVQEAWPSSAYQTVYATELGSAEMPSAGRAFTPEIITALVARGVQVVPLLLHCGVASLEDHEPPYEEWYRVPAATALAINAARQAGGRVIAVGTTVVRALETVADAQGHVHPGEGWTALVITPERGIHAVDGLLTGWHEPHASHLSMLAAFASREHLRHVYAAALAARYLWHEFGDLHLLLP
ncbi:MAG: S-adenosylmethionine:tRNA ribosyltransferase-isomerase [Ktedonobacterales bacterium]|nr:S-adenosylmethionine:tRNA ribosyltransferase-isomerase [Ktedonobacterales bacterium]